MKKSISHLAHFLVEKLQVSFLKNPGKYLLVLLTLWIGLYSTPAQAQWVTRSSAADISWKSITYGDGLFVAVAETGTNNRVMTSPDGITWTARTSAAENQWNSVAYGNTIPLIFCCRKSME